MRKIIFLTFLIIASCSSNNLKDDTKFNFDYSDSMSFENFKIKLRDYTKNSSYPNIDN